MAPPRSLRSPKAAPKMQSQEDAFWNTPSSKTPLTNFDDSLLLDESVDLANVTTSFDTPLVQRTYRSSRTLLTPTDHANPAETQNDLSALQEGTSAVDAGEETIRDDPADVEEAEQDASGDATAISSDHLSPAPRSFPPLPTSPQESDTSVIEIEPREAPAIVLDNDTSKKQKIRITPDVERIAVCILRSLHCAPLA
jgi:hypothetical protein